MHRAKLTKADAARQLQISRTTLCKLIHEGKVSPTPDGTIDTAELVRAVSTLHMAGRPGVPCAMNAQPNGPEHDERPPTAYTERALTLGTERQLTSSYTALVDTLRS